MNADEGTEVKRNDLIATLEVDELTAQVFQAKAGLANAGARYKSAVAGFRQEEITRSEALYAQAQSAYDGAMTAMKNAELNYNKATEAEFTPKNVKTNQERAKLVFAVKIKLNNPDRKLKIGMPADAIIPLND